MAQAARQPRRFLINVKIANAHMHIFLHTLPGSQVSPSCSVASTYTFYSTRRTRKRSRQMEVCSYLAFNDRRVRGDCQFRALMSRKMLSHR